MFFFSSDANKKEYLKGTPSTISIANKDYKVLPTKKIMKVKEWKASKDSIRSKIKRQEEYMTDSITGNDVEIIGNDGEIIGYSFRQKGFIIC